MIDFEELKNLFIDNKKFLITTHVNPDADAIGSEIAIYLLLIKLGKDVRIVNRSETPYSLKFLDKKDKIETFDPEVHQNIFNDVDLIIAVDFNRIERLTQIRDYFLNSPKKKICIDHHQDTENVFDYQFVDVKYSATGHIIYDFIKRTKIVQMNYDLAYPIYTAIMTDTGSFRYERTTPELHRIIAELLEFGVTPGEVFDYVYDQNKMSKIKLLGRALESLQVFGEKKQIAYMILSQKDFNNANALEYDTDGFVNFTLSIENVQIGLLFLELKQGFKVSFRSKGIIPVNKLASEFSGGGHINAAGTRIYDKKLDEYLPKILNKAVEYLP